MQKIFHNTFTFLDWHLDVDKHTLDLNYSVENIGRVREVLTFPCFTLQDINRSEVNAACELIHLMCGVSYYKAGLAHNIIFENKHPSAAMAKFIQKTWKHGLAELAFENHVSLNVDFNGVSTLLTSLDSEVKRVLTPWKPLKSLVPLGGGKDSLVTVEELKEQAKNISLFMVGNLQLIKEVAQFIGLPLIQVKRKIDAKLIEYNKTGEGFNGHVPITAINSAIAVLTALLFDFDEVVFSNEKSANSANTINADGDEVNHQYSKSDEFEKDLSKIMTTEIFSNVRYYSQQRNYSELEILEKFSQYPQYFPVFSSCNRNFHIDGSHNKNSKWCCHCPKCRFVFLGLAPFIDKEQLLSIFGHNLLDDLTQQKGFEELLGITGFKPFECVGEIQESQQAFDRIKNKAEWQSDKLIKNLIRPRAKLDSKQEPNSNLALGRIRIKNLAIWGFGVEGRATAEYLQKKGIEFKVLCSEEERDDSYSCITTPVDKMLLDSFDLVIKSPGISPYTDLVRQATCEFTSPTAIWFANEKNTTVIAVTGTKGKSTTVSMLAHILDYCGKSVNLVGNIGQALISSTSDYEYIVLESSSFQIYDGNIQADIAVVTNLYAEHVDWHDGKENYFRDKLKLLLNAKVKIINAQNPILKQMVDSDGVEYFNLKEAYHVIEETLLFKEKETLNLSQISLIGKHNLENIGAVLSVCKKLGLDIALCVEAIKSFKPLAHRLQNLGRIGQHFAINDSIATTPIATLAAMQTVDLSKTTLLVGGFDRGNDWRDFVIGLNKTPPNLLIISGQNSAIIQTHLEQLNAQFNYLVCDNLKCAIKLAQNQSQVDDTILLSPGAPSFDQFDSYIKRGIFFEEELKNNV